jgi:hypothetical protein
MAAPVRLREDFDAPSLRGLAKRARDAGQLRRLLALAEIYDGESRDDAARIGDVGLQTVRDWVLRFNALGPEGLIDAKAPGQVPKLNDAQRQELSRMTIVLRYTHVHGQHIDQAIGNIGRALPKQARNGIVRNDAKIRTIGKQSA